jgi:HK97 family phage prohead protease
MTIAQNIASHHKISDAASVGIKRATIDKMETSTSQRMISGIVCTDSLDMEGEVVVPAGLDTSYFPERVKAVYLNHNYDELPVAKCRKMVINDRGQMFCQTVIARGGLGDDLLSLMEEGILNGLSIGFVTTTSTPPKPEEDRYRGAKAVVRSAKLLEYSIVSMPCNPDALIEFVSKGLIRRSSAVAFGLPDSPVRKAYPTTGPARVERCVVVDRRIVVVEE